jgi:hypothetical protein
VVWRATVSAPEKEPPPRQRDTLLMDTAELAEALNAKATCELVPKMLAVWSGEEAQAVSMNRRGTLPGALPVAVAVAAAEVVPVCVEVAVSVARLDAAAVAVPTALAVAVCVAVPVAADAEPVWVPLRVGGAEAVTKTVEVAIAVVEERAVAEKEEVAIGQKKPLGHVILRTIRMR